LLLLLVELPPNVVGHTCPSIGSVHQKHDQELAAVQASVEEARAAVEAEKAAAAEKV